MHLLLRYDLAFIAAFHFVYLQSYGPETTKKQMRIALAINFLEELLPFRSYRPILIYHSICLTDKVDNTLYSFAVIDVNAMLP